MSKTVNNSTASSITTTDYLTGFQYTGGTMAFFPHAEGYVNVRTGPAYNYVFNYTDHLGNVRLSYAKDQNARGGELKILEENHYYAFGLKHSNYNTDIFVIAEQGTIKQLTNPLIGIGYKYKFNGKELQEELGLNMYDYGARNYDAALGRWMNVDPLAETSRRWSTYTYCYNNPLRFVDPDGMQADDWRNKAGQLIYDPKANGGKGDYTEHASKNDKRLGNSLQSTEKGKEQFNKLVNSEQPTTVEINFDSKPVTRDGGIIMGVTTNEVSVGSDLQGNVEDVVVKKSNITINIASIEKVEVDLKTTAFSKSPLKGLSFEQLLGVTFGHEIEHITIENILFEEKGGNKEAAPTAVGYQIAEELKTQKK